MSKTDEEQKRHKGVSKDVKFENCERRSGLSRITIVKDWGINKVAALSRRWGSGMQRRDAVATFPPYLG
jgi:hypothetical protein